MGQPRKTSLARSSRNPQPRALPAKFAAARHDTAEPAQSAAALTPTQAGYTVGLLAKERLIGLSWSVCRVRLE
eukprot:scaffold24328_cov48-Phaeocystis_antarctica.AAC.2